MNWTAFREARDVIRRLRPEQFDYRELPFGRDRCGCVVHHCYLKGMLGSEPMMALSKFRLVVDVQMDEAEYLFGSRKASIDPLGRSYNVMGNSATGCSGIREAMRRFDVVAERYGGWPAEIVDEVAPEAEAAHVG